VFGTELKHFGSAREFETLAGGIREFGLLRNIGERAAAARAETGAREMATEKLSFPEWADKDVIAVLTEARDGETSKVIGTSVDFPQWKTLSTEQRQDLISRGFTPDVDRMGNPRIKVSRQARVDMLRDAVIKKQELKMQDSDTRLQKAKKLKDSDIEQILVDRYGRGNIRSAWKASGEKEYLKWRKAEAERASDTEAARIASELEPVIREEFKKQQNLATVKFIEHKRMPNFIRSLLQGQQAIGIVSPTVDKLRQDQTYRSSNIQQEVANQVNSRLQDIGKSGYRKDRKVSVKVGSEDVTMRLDELVTLAGYLQNKDTMRSVSNWITIDGKRHYWTEEGRALGSRFTEVMDKDKDRASEYRAKARVEAERQINEALKQLTAEERQVIDKVLDINNGQYTIDGQQVRLIDAITSTAQKYLGKDITTVEGVYMPGRIDIAQGTDVKQDSVIRRVLREAGLMSERVHHNYGMNIKGALELTQQNMNTGALVVGRMPMTHTMRAVLEALRPEAAKGSVGERMLRDAVKAVDRIEGQFLDDASREFRAILKMQDTARFSGPTVWISQLASLPNAAAELGLGKVLGNIVSHHSKEELQKVIDKSPVIKARMEKNMYAPELWESGALDGGRQYSRREGAGIALDVAEKIRQAMLTPMGLFDKKAITTVLGASLDWSKEQGFTGDKLYSEAARKAFDTIGYTQPSFLPEHRSLFATDMGYAARIFTRYRTMADSALNQIVRYSINAEREGYSPESVKRMSESILYSALLPALYLAVARPVVRSLMGAAEGKDDDDDEKMTSKMITEGLAGASFAVPFSQFWLTPLIQAVRADNPAEGMSIIRRVSNEGGILSQFAGTTESIYNALDLRNRAKAYELDLNADGTRMSAAEKRRAQDTIDRKSKRLIDQIGRTTDEWTGLPIGRMTRLGMRGTEKALNENR